MKKIKLIALTPRAEVVFRNDVQVKEKGVKKKLVSENPVVLVMELKGWLRVLIKKDAVAIALKKAHDLDVDVDYDMEAV